MKIIILIVMISISLVSCARQISSDVYASPQIGAVSVTYPGKIKSIRQVYVEERERLEEHGLGLAGGGMAGGVMGNALSKGKFIPTAVGAVAGAVAGSLAEKKLKQQLAIEYVVELDNGSLMTVVQGKDQLFVKGQPVYVMVSPYGRSRVVSQ